MPNRDLVFPFSGAAFLGPVDVESGASSVSHSASTLSTQTPISLLHITTVIPSAHDDNQDRQTSHLFEPYGLMGFPYFVSYLLLGPPKRR
jgi:hypothetical protein